MRKIKGLDEFFKNSKLDSENNDTEIENGVQSGIAKLFETVNHDKFNKKNQLSLMGGGISLALSLLFMGLFATKSSTVFLVLAIAMFFCFLVAVWFCMTNKREWYGVVNENISFNDLCKNYFESRYENVSVKTESKINEKLIGAYRGEGVPSDATILKYMSGLSFDVEGICVNTGIVTWHWYRTYSTGKSTYTKEYKLNKFISYVPNVPPRWDGFKMSFAMSGLAFNKGKELENEKFNKMFSYTHNDPVKLRVLFTPLIQEIFVENFGKTSAAKTFELDFVLNQVITTKNLTVDNPFQLDKVPFGNKQVIAKKIFEELESDFRYLEEQITIITTLREFIVNR